MSKYRAWPISTRNPSIVADTPKPGVTSVAVASGTGIP